MAAMAKDDNWSARALLGGFQQASSLALRRGTMRRQVQGGPSGGEVLRAPLLHRVRQAPLRRDGQPPLCPARLLDHEGRVQVGCA